MSLRTDIEEKSIDALQVQMEAGRLTSEELTRFYIDRINKLDRSGPTLRAVIAINPLAVQQAQELDIERRLKGSRGPLHGIPLLFKDNIETLDPLANTAGSYALKENVTLRDAAVVAGLRKAGVVILGKANLSQWGHARFSNRPSGWSSIGGTTKNPYVLDRFAGVSSGGSAVAVAANMAVGSIATETYGSLVQPASLNSLVSIKPTLGLLSRSHIVPFSPLFDTPGPIARCVSDVAHLLTAMIPSGDERHMLFERDIDIIFGHENRVPRALDDFWQILRDDALENARLGVMYLSSDFPPAVDALFKQALRTLQTLGAVTVPIEPPSFEAKAEADSLLRSLLVSGIPAGLNAYLADLPSNIAVRSFDQLVLFNRNDPRESTLHQDKFEEAMRSGPAARLGPLERVLVRTGHDVLDKIMENHRLRAIVAPTMEPAFLNDGTDMWRVPSPAELAALAGLPHLTLPMGAIRGLPVGLSFIGQRWSDFKLLSLGFAFEQTAQARIVPRFIPSLGRGLDRRLSRGRTL